VIDDDVAALVTSGASVILGTVDACGQPDAGRVYGVRVDGEVVRACIPASGDTAIANLRSTAVVAVTATSVSTLRSVQLKGRALAVEAPDATDRAAAARYVEDFTLALWENDRTPRELVQAMIPSELVVVTLTVDEVFDQTPGPGAGTRMWSR
jgi:hypothetical protein